LTQYVTLKLRKRGEDVSLIHPGPVNRCSCQCE
jgi:hypothetical protein